MASTPTWCVPRSRRRQRRRFLSEENRGSHQPARTSERGPKPAFAQTSRLDGAEPRAGGSWDVGARDPGPTAACSVLTWDPPAEQVGFPGGVAWAIMAAHVCQVPPRRPRVSRACAAHPSRRRPTADGSGDRAEQSALVRDAAYIIIIIASARSLA